MGFHVELPRVHGNFDGMKNDGVGLREPYWYHGKITP